MPLSSAPSSSIATYRVGRIGLANQAAGKLVRRRLESIARGGLLVEQGDQRWRFGPGPEEGQIVVRHPRFWRRVGLGGAVGAADSYLDGDWESPALTSALRVLARNAATLQTVERGAPALLRPGLSLLNRWRRNSLRGSRRNIAAHYDLGNKFFSLMLDPTMTYSSGYFPHKDATLQEASTEKYDRICRRLGLTEDDHVLEIGSGWGGFAVHAATRYGCRVTTTTISDQQFSYALQRINEAGLGDRVTLLKQDYRNLSGQYDKLVSIEMIEAVGEQYLPGYFAKCSSLLRPEGAMLLQAITIPDCRYDRYRHSVDFIQKHIFPGGFLPSPGAITGCLGRRTDLRVAHLEDFSSHYARTLELWRNQLWRRLDEVRQLGFDDRFLRTWKYYLCYCEAGFAERQVGVSQWMLAKPQCRWC